MCSAESFPRVWQIGWIVGSPRPCPIFTLVALGYPLILRIIALARAQQASIRLIHKFLCRAERRQAPTLSHSLFSGRLRGQMIPGIVRRRHYFGLHVQESDHFVKIKLFRRPLVHLFAATVDETLESQHFRAMNVNCLANALKSLFWRGQGQLQIFHCFIHLLGQGLSFS